MVRQGGLLCLVCLFFFKCLNPTQGNESSDGEGEGRPSPKAGTKVGVLNTPPAWSPRVESQVTPPNCPIQRVTHTPSESSLPHVYDTCAAEDHIACIREEGEMYRK